MLPLHTIPPLPLSSPFPSYSVESLPQCSLKYIDQLLLLARQMVQMSANSDTLSNQTHGGLLSLIIKQKTSIHKKTSLPGVYLASEFPHPPPKRRELSQVDNGGFWPVSPGGGRDGAVMLLGGKGTFHSSWAREVLVTDPGDHVDLESLFLATKRHIKTTVITMLLELSPCYK